MHLRPKFLYGNDRKSHADLLIYKSEKMSLFDQKILDVANLYGSQRKVNGLMGMYTVQKVYHPQSLSINELYNSKCGKNTVLELTHNEL